MILLRGGEGRWEERGVQRREGCEERGGVEVVTVCASEGWCVCVPQCNSRVWIALMVSHASHQALFISVDPPHTQ